LVTCKDGSWFGHLTPSAIRYFDDKKHYKERLNRSSESSSEPSIYAPGGNVIIGNVICSIITTGDIYTMLENQIEEKGGEDKEDLNRLLDEAREIAEEIKNTGSVPVEKKGYYTNLKKHAERHGWFYGGVMNLIGSAVFKLL